MIEINELLRLPLFCEFQLTTGEEGLSNIVNNIVILEYESISQNYEVFSKGDFVLTSLFFAKDCPESIELAFKNLIKRKISGLAIKTVFFRELPERVMELAKRNHIPVFFFHDAYMEDLIISANELLKSKLQYLIYEEKVTSLINPTSSRLQVSNVAKEINPAFRPLLYSAYLTSKNNLSADDIPNYFRRILYKRYRISPLSTYSFVKYRQGMIIILTFDQETTDLLSEIHSLLKAIELNPDNFYIGMADNKVTLNDLDISLNQAIYANRICQLNHTSYKLYSEVGIYQFLAPLCDELTIQASYKNFLHILKTYDKKYTSELFTTLETFVQYNGEISKTAKALFQHPNTIRYRIQKASTLLGCKEDDFYMIAYVFVKLYHLVENTTI